MIVKHSSGGNSTLGFKSYDQGRTKWQGETLDFVWFDEEPPLKGPAKFTKRDVKTAVSAVSGNQDRLRDVPLSAHWDHQSP